MQEYAQKPEQSSSENNSRSSGQPPISEILQAYKNGTLQRMSVDEEELLQAKTRDKSSERETLQLYTEYTHRDKSRYNSLIQGMFDTPQRKGVGNEELLQGKFESSSVASESTIQREVKTNNTGLPDNLKSGIENLSGYSMDDVKVHYNSDKPAQLSALAYAQGTDIHVAPGQEKHLPHEAWHVVQQMQGRVQPTIQLQGVNVNDNEGLEKEADVMGEQVKRCVIQPTNSIVLRNEVKGGSKMVQRKKCKARVVWDVTHEVYLDDKGSLFGDYLDPFKNEGKELRRDNKIAIDDESIFLSRRGANQENENRRYTDSVSCASNKWVKLIKEPDETRESGYVRCETIEVYDEIQDFLINSEYKCFKDMFKDEYISKNAEGKIEKYVKSYSPCGLRLCYPDEKTGMVKDGFKNLGEAKEKTYKKDKGVNFWGNAIYFVSDSAKEGTKDKKAEEGTCNHSA